LNRHLASPRSPRLIFYLFPVRLNFVFPTPLLARPFLIPIVSSIFFCSLLGVQKF
jgi:hypothetical protein